MKAIYKNIALAALALGAAACSQENDFSPSYLNDPDAVRITAQVGTDDVTGGFTRSNPLGTAEEQVKFNTGDQIAVAAGTQDAVTYTFDEDTKTWTPETGKYLKWETTPMTFTAWYPVTVGTDVENFTPSYGKTASLDELVANDYMTCTSLQSKGEDRGVSLEMQRQMVRIVVNKIDYNNQYDATTNAVTAIAITAGNGKYENGEWTGDNVTAQMYQHTDGNWYAVLPPTATAETEETFLTITLTGVESPLIVKGIPVTEAGNSYNLALTVGKAKASIGAVSVEDWMVGTISGGVAEEVEKNSYIPIDPNGSGPAAAGGHRGSWDDLWE